MAYFRRMLHQHSDNNNINNSDRKSLRIVPKRTQHKLTFKNFLTLFQEISIPASLTTSSLSALTKELEPMHNDWAVNFLLDNSEELDEFMEFMACFSLPRRKEDEYVALIYWQGTIDGNGYFLVTMDKMGKVIDKLYIAGTLYTKEELVQTICTLKENHVIHQVIAAVDANSGIPSPPSEHKQAGYTIQHDGTIVEILV